MTENTWTVVELFTSTTLPCFVDMPLVGSPLLVALVPGIIVALTYFYVVFVAPHWGIYDERHKDKNQITSPECQTIVRRSSKRDENASSGNNVVPESVNFHLSRRCNYKCGFCFHTAKTSFELPIEEAKRGLKLLTDAGMVKVNFSGGEPFLPQGGRYVGELVKFCKQELGLPSVSIVSNGSLIREKWFVNYGEFLDILAVSCDSFDPNTNAIIGRQQHQQKKDHIESLMRVREWCNKYKIAFKVNTVVNTFNKDEDMCESIQELRPVRWKVFQCLIIDGENAGDDASLRDAEQFVITDDEFHEFIARHKSVSQLVPESNDAMRYSYLIVDEYMRFLNGGTKQASKSILDVGVEAAIDAAKFDEKMFYKRGGKYTWSKADMNLEW